MKQALIGVVVAALSQSSALAREQPPNQRAGAGGDPGIYKLAELTWPQIDALDRERTLIILTVGMIEQHGPHLPVGSDTIGVMYEADVVSRRVSRALPQWNIVMMPAANYGHAGANEIGNMPVHPGTYGIRQSTLRSLVADIGSQLAQNRFKWIFVLNGHAAPTHNIALNEASDFVSQTFNVTMLHLTALFRADADIQARGEQVTAKYFSAADRASFGMDVHAGVGETSQMLAVRPDLVRLDYRKLPSRAGRTFEELRDIARAPGWQGYMSAPARATPQYGRAVKEWWIEGVTNLILRAVRGEDMLAHARLPGATIPPPLAPILEQVLAREAAFEDALEKWLAQRSKR